MPGEIKYTKTTGDTFGATLRSPLGYKLVVTGTLDLVEPEIDGHEPMLGNPALVHNTWAYAKHRTLADAAEDDKEKKSHLAQAKTHEQAATGIAELAESIGPVVRRAWCSGCLSMSDHRKVEREGLGIPICLCTACGSPTLKCASPTCDKMAVRKLGAIRVPQFCAEHRHEIPSFSRANEKVQRLEEYAELLEFEATNLSRVSRITLASTAAAGAVATGGILAAPALGGIVGSLAGYTGAAASSYGLAFLGGGAVAAGGFGMAGGTYVVAAMGAALGGALGTSVTNAYVGEDKSFRIEKFIDGPGTPVIVARGFSTEKDRNWAAAMDAVENRYPDSPIYRLHWGSRELNALGVLLIKNLGVKQVMGVAMGLAARASKTAKLGPLAPVILTSDIMKNPWHTAKVRADRTGVALAGILAHTELEDVILVGHSLGGRAMITAAETLATSKDGPSVKQVHILGAAEGQKSDWRLLNESVSDKVHNYYSTRDGVLKYLYTTAQGGSTAVGLKGFRTSYPNIADHDVSDEVGGHSEYFAKVQLR